MSVAAAEALATLRTVEAALSERHPDGRRPHPLADRPDAPAAALFRHGDALTLISLDVRGEGAGEWSLGATSLLALAGGEIDAALEWVNERNRRLAVGKYYCAHSREAGMAAVAYDTWVQGAAFAACGAEGSEAGGRLATVLMALVANVLDTGAAEAAQAAAAIGGRPPNDSDADRQALLVVALG